MVGPPARADQRAERNRAMNAQQLAPPEQPACMILDSTTQIPNVPDRPGWQGIGTYQCPRCNQLFTERHPTFAGGERCRFDVTPPAV